MEWAFEGIGTFLIGLLLGGGAGAAVTWRIAIRNRNQRQVQKAGNSSNQIQAGGDIQR